MARQIGMRDETEKVYSKRKKVIHTAETTPAGSLQYHENKKVIGKGDDRAERRMAFRQFVSKNLQMAQPAQSSQPARPAPAQRINPFDSITYQNPAAQAMHQQTGWMDPTTKALWDIANQSIGKRGSVSPSTLHAVGGLQFDVQNNRDRLDSMVQMENRRQQAEDRRNRQQEAFDNAKTRADNARRTQQVSNNPMRPSYVVKNSDGTNEIHRPTSDDIRPWESIQEAPIASIVRGVTNGSGVPSLGYAVSGAFANATGNERLKEAIRRDSMNEALRSQQAQERHPLAYGAGNIGGNLALMAATGAAVNAIGGAALGARNFGKIGNAALRMGTGALNFAATTAVQESGAAVNGLMSPEDYAKDVLVSGGAGLTQSIASMAAAGGIEKILMKTGNQTAFLDFVKNLTAASTGSAARIGFEYGFEDKNPTSTFRSNYLSTHAGATEEDVRRAYEASLRQKAAIQFGTSFCFSLLSSYRSTLETNKRMSAYLENEFDQLERDMESLGNMRISEGEIGSWKQSVNDRTNRLRNTLSENYFAGQQDKVNAMMELLDEIDDRADMAYNNIMGAGEADAAASNTPPSQGFVDAIGAAVRQGAEEAGTVSAPSASTADMLTEIANTPMPASDELNMTVDELNDALNSPFAVFDADEARAAEEERRINEAVDNINMEVDNRRWQAEQNRKRQRQIEKGIPAQTTAPTTAPTTETAAPSIDIEAEAAARRQQNAANLQRRQEIEEGIPAPVPAPSTEELLQEIANTEVSPVATSQQQPEAPAQENRTPAPELKTDETERETAPAVSPSSAAPSTDELASIFPEGAAEVYKKYAAEDSDDILYYHDNMLKAYQAGVKEQSLQSLMLNDEDFEDFWFSHEDAVEDIYRQGYLSKVQRDNENRIEEAQAPLNEAPAEGKIEETEPSTPAPRTEFATAEASQLSSDLFQRKRVDQNGFRYSVRGDDGQFFGSIERIGEGTVRNARDTVYTVGPKATIQEVADDLAAVAENNRFLTESNENAPEPKRPVSTGENTTVAKAGTPQAQIAESVKSMLESGKDFTVDWLYGEANKAFGGTMAEGAYTVKDAYDGMELAINKYLMSADFVKNGNGSLATAKNTLTSIQRMMSKIPTQSKRTEEMEQFQQYSTPPNIAYTAARVANINQNDVVLEPSAGIGGLALWGKAWGAKVYGNELSERRLAFLNELGLDGTFNENAEQINNVLPDNIKPTVVIMNPPFSATAGRMTKNATKNATRHITQALDRLEDGGRLVAILGRGMADDSPSFRKWWNELRQDYTIRANVRIDGSNYKKYGTTFDDQLVVIDKIGPQTGETITGEYKDLSELLTDLEGVRNERTQLEGRNTESDRLVSGSRNDSGQRNGESLQGGRDTGRNGGVAAGQRSGTETGSDGGSRRNRNRVRQGNNTGNNGRAETAGESAVSGVSEERTGRSGSENAGQTDNSVRLVPGSVQRPRVKDINLDSAFTEYVPAKVNIAGAKPHPGRLAESAAMGAVEPPAATYTPHLPQELIEKGVVSSAQLENIVYAGQAHSQVLPDGNRKGYFIGDGTGVGKGRQLSAIILDNFNQGRKKALWISKSQNLYEDAQRDWKDLGGNPKEVYSLSKVKKANDIPYGDGILFGTYDTLGSRKEDGIKKLQKWLGKDFDGVIALDEAHGMAGGAPVKGARGTRKPSQKALWGIELQKAFPNARVVYASATGASSPENMVYLPRLGLWGKGTAFTDFNDFYTKISSGGLAAMELVARDMKAMGVYLARSISYDDVTYDTLEHDLSPVQTEIYNRMSDAWQVVLRDINKALKITGGDKPGGGKGAAYSAFWGSLQRFYNQIITSMSMPSVIEDIKAELANGRSVVIQLTNTNAAQADRAIEKNAKEGGDLEDLDLTPSEELINMVRKSFPVQSYEEYTDDEGNTRVRPVLDSKGNPVEDKKAVELREQLIAEIGQMQVPDGPLEMLLDAFGTDQVAEVTGRNRRVVYKKQADGSMKRVIEKRGDAASLADANAFQAGKKRILVFSEKGGTGKSYHADLRAKNQQQRVHYLLQPGWKADAAIQGLGRTHRTNQASAPIYKLVTTNVMGQKRFTSTIARRLNQMGALTKGQRDAGSGVFSEKDNLENPIAMDALASYYKSAPDDVIRKLGIKIKDSNGKINESADDLRNISKFLNRILALNVDEQNQVFEDFYAVLEQMTDAAIANGTIDRGMENYKADKIELIDEKTVRKDPSGADTKYVQMKTYNKPKPLKYSSLPDAHRGYMGLYRLDDGSVRAAYDIGNITDQRGNVSRKFRLDSPVRGKFSTFSEKTFKERTTKLPESKWKAAWEEEISKLPEYDESTLHLLTGTLLPIWDKLPEQNTRVMRVVTSDGNQYLGRVINPDQIDSVLRGLGANRTVKTYTADEAYSEVMDKGREVALRDNKWKINRRRVSGEWRMEVTGNNVWSLPKYVQGIITEKINYQYRYFIPTGDRGKEVLRRLLEFNPVQDVRTSSSSEIQQMRTGTKNAAGAAPSPASRWEASRVGDKNKAPMPISDIISKMRHDFGFNLTTGYVRGKGIQGTFNTQDKGLRTRIANNLPTVAHEFGHWLDDRYGITNHVNITPQIHKELEAAYQKTLGKSGANYRADQISGEGMAEFVREYLQNRETAAIEYPELTKHVLGSLTPEDLAKLTTFADEINAYYSLDADSAASSIRLKEQGNPDFRTRTEKLQDANDRFQQAWVDSNYAIKQFQKEMGGDAYTLATNAAYTDAVAARILEGDLTDIHGRYVGPGLGAALHGIDTKNKDEYIAFNEYLIVRHGPEWLADGKMVFADDRKNSTQWMERRQSELESQYPEFEAAAERLYEFIKNMTQTWGVDTGLISQETIDSLNKKYPNYVPFNRAVPIKRRGRGAGRGFANQAGPLKAARGSGLDFIAPVDNVIDMVVTYTNIASKNRVMQAMRDAAIRHGDATWMEKVPMPVQKQTFDLRGMKGRLSEAADQALIQGEIDSGSWTFAGALIDQINDQMVKYVEGRPKNDVVTVLVNGEKEFWKINDPMLLESVTNLSKPTLNGFLEVYARFSRFLTMNLTGNNPIWGISNLIRDYGTYSNYTPNKNLVTRLAGIGETYVNAWKEFLGKDIDPIYYEYLAMGGGTGSAYTADINLAERVRNEFGRGFWQRTWTKYNPVAFISFLMDTIEQGPRFATYKYCRTEMGMSAEEALYASKDVTVNFRKFGTMGRQMNALMPFSNAAVQGADKMVRYFTADDVAGGRRARANVAAGRWARWIAGSMIAALIPYMLNNRDEEAEEAYGRLSNYTKNNYFCFYLGDEKFLTLPKPRELAAITTGIERTIDSTKGDEFAFAEFDEYLADAILPDVASDIAQIPGDALNKKQGLNQALNNGVFQVLGDFGIAGVGVQIASNKDFLGRPIVSQKYDGYLSKDQYNDKTSKMAYWIGQGLGLSPMQTDHFAKNTLGYMWKIPSALFPVNPENADMTLGMKNSYVRDSLHSNDIVNRMYDDADFSARDSKSNPDDGEKTLIGQLDANKVTFYNNFSKLEREAGEDRNALKDVLRMIDAYQRAPEGKATNQTEELVYNLVRQNNDKDLLPGVMKTKMKDSGGKEHVLTPAQYVRFQKEYESQYWKNVEKYVYTGADEKEQATLIEHAKALAAQQATKYALGMVNAEYKVEKSSELAYIEAGGSSLSNYNDFVEAKKEGKQDGAVDYLKNSNLSESERQALFSLYYKLESTKDGKVTDPLGNYKDKMK